MTELFATGEDACCGYRLEKLEVFNWGTFDSSQGNVHTVRPNGANTLLIGQNGSGKSTLVDAILTLLVRPVVRNYNVAAGARKQERDERTYIRCAYNRSGRSDDNHAEIQYLRPQGRHYSALLACFRNEQNDAFTLAQILHLKADGSVEKVYCFAPDERSIAEHCADLEGTERLRQQMESRGFRATRSYTEYFNWLARATNIRPKAMDMLNQTVAVKDIESLNRFIRDHMLESKPWRKKIDDLQAHFTQLREAHESLVRVRRQYELLKPLSEKAASYREQLAELEAVKRRLEATSSFFRQRTVDLLEPECAAKEKELEELTQRKQRQSKEISEQQEEVRRLKNAIEQAGGDRLRELPYLIEQESSRAEQKRQVWLRLKNAIAMLGLSANVADAAALARLHAQLPSVVKDITRKIAALEQTRNQHVVERNKLKEQRDEDESELQALRQRQGNLPEWAAVIRRRLCEELRLREKDLPFVAELVAVRPDERAWQASIEMVLRGFALSLLVPQRHYSAVSAHINQTRLTDSRGRGRRLTYQRVGDRMPSRAGKAGLGDRSLLGKLELREGHPLVPWVKAELEQRFNVRCCESIEEFQAAQDFAMTRERHLKWRGGQRHEKDDRESVADPRNFVLGWDNREKRQHLTQAVERLNHRIGELDDALRKAEEQLQHLRAQETAGDEVARVTNFDEIDFGAHEQKKRALEQEKRALEEADDTIRALRKQLVGAEQRIEQVTQQRDETVTREDRVRRELDQAKQLIGNAKQILGQRRADGSLAVHAETFEAIEALLPEELTPANLIPMEQAFEQQQRQEEDRLRTLLDPLKNALCAIMNRYLREFPDEQADLDATIECLDSFCSLYEQIERDDLPRHEARFKERLNEKVIQEIGLLNAAFQTERTEIDSKIELLNQSLRQLDYRPGTFMRLEPRPVRDREIVEFQDSLRECLAGTFEGTLEADEARYLRIEQLLTRLRDEERWRDKVTDVRRWFDFVARELDRQTEQEKAYYEDSTGQSGGEKAKLAFTILVAAIAYQYDIDPGRPSSDRFAFVVVDEMFSKVDDQYAEYALELFKKFGLQLLIVAPLDAKARVTEPYVGCYLHVVKDAATHCSELFSMTAREFAEAAVAPQEASG